LCISCALLHNIRKQQSKQKSIAEPNESKPTSDTTDRQIDTSKKNSPSFTDTASADKSISIATPSTDQKKNTQSCPVDLPLNNSSTEDCDNGTISNEDVQGGYDVPIAERLKLRREKRKAETDNAIPATHNNTSTPIAERLKRRRTNNAPDTVEQDTTTSKSTRKRKASSSLDSNKTTDVTTPKSSKKKTCASKEDLDYSKIGIRQLASGNKWSVEIGYHKKRCYPGTYEDKEHAVLANKVAREYLLATRDLQLTDEEIQSNIDLAKEAALKAVNDLLEDGGASDSISEEEEEDDVQPPDSTEEEDIASTTTATSDGISVDREKHIQSKITHRRQLLAWVRAARLACEKNKEVQPDFIQDTLNSSDQAHASSPAPSTPSVSGEFASEVANYQALTNTASCQQSSAEKTDIKTVGVYRVTNGWVCHWCVFCSYSAFF